MLFGCKGYEIRITWDYIMFSRLSFDIVDNMSYEEIDKLLEDEVLFGYDRTDGEDYYRSFHDQEVVDFIAQQIALFNL